MKRRCDYCDGLTSTPFEVREGDCTGWFDKDICFQLASEKKKKIEDAQDEFSF